MTRMSGLDVLLGGRLKELLLRLEESFAMSGPIPEGAWANAMRDFVAFAGAVTIADWDDLRRLWPQVQGLRKRLHPMYGQYLRMREFSEAAAVLSANHGSLMGTAPTAPQGFARSAYDRVGDMFSNVDFEECQRFVMIGCGPLPVTLIHVTDRTSVRELVGLDVDPESLRVAKEFLAHLGCHRVRVINENGLMHDFAGADVIYVANMTVPKGDVLKRIADTAKIGTQVIVRDPVAMGNLLAENSAEDMDARFTVVGEGEAAPQFLSRDRYLRLTG